MKKNLLTSILASFLALSSLGILSACGNGNLGGNDDDPPVADTDKTPEEYEDWVNSWSKPGHLYIHYNRGDKGGYDNFCVWLWQKSPKNLEGSLWAFSGETKVSDTLILKPMSTGWMTGADVGLGGTQTYLDEYGVIAEIDLFDNKLVGGKSGTPTSFENAKTLGFLMVEQSSMGGKTHWTSDGGADSFIENFDDPTNWRGGYKTGSIHVYLSTGNFANYTYSCDGGVPSPKINPVETDTTGQFNSKTETIADNYGVSTTSDAFKEIGVGYQIFVASFRDSNGDGMGDIRGIIDSLDYLEDLGVEALWLTPIQKSGSYHGYDIDDYYAVDPKFGTLEDYRELIYKAHERGMKVLMDLVLNHTSKSNVWFQKSQWAVNSGAAGAETDDSGINWRDVYTWKYGTEQILKYNPNTKAYEKTTVEQDAKSDNPSWYRDGESNYYYYGKFGSSMPEINFENKATRTLVKEMAKYWLGFGVDGFRLDAVKHIYMKDEVADTGSDLIITDVGEKTAYDDEKGKYITKAFDYSSDMTKNIAWWKEFAGDLKAVYPDCFLVGENFDGWGTRLAGYYQALDSQFSFSNYYHIPAYIYNNQGGASNYNLQASETFDIYAGNGTYPLAGQGVSVPGGRRSDYIDGGFTSNHDVPRAINQVNGRGTKDGTTASDNITGTTTELNRAKIHAAVTLLNSGLSWIYYGDELGMSSNTKTHVGTYGNENSIDIWYRQPFLWNDMSKRPNYKAGQYRFELDNYNLQLSNSNKGITYSDGNVSTTNEMYQWYKDIIEIKKMYPKGAHIVYDNCSTNVMKINVSGENGKNMVVFIHVGVQNSDYILNVPGYNVVKTVGCSGVSQGSNIGKMPYSVVALQQA